jgi:hypothetical protein
VTAPGPGTPGLTKKARVAERRARVAILKESGLSLGEIALQVFGLDTTELRARVSNDLRAVKAATEPKRRVPGPGQCHRCFRPMPNILSFGPYCSPGCRPS